MRRRLLVAALVVAVASAGWLVPLAARAAECNGFPFSEVAAETGIAFLHERGATQWKHLPETMGAGLAWLDADGDGWLDLYLVQSGPFPPDGSTAARDALWRNRGDGTFESVTDAAGIGEQGCGQGVLAADLDGDGDTDLYITNFGGDVLWANRGDGTFERLAGESGPAVDGWSSSAAGGDFDGDGDLDLYVTRYVEYDPADELFCGDLEAGTRDYCDPSLFPGALDRFFENLGEMRFADRTEAVGIGRADGKGLGVVFVDLDGDLAQDLYVANDITSNFLFANRGDGSFEDLSLLSGAAANREGKFEAGMGLGIGDIDGDSDPDILVTNFDVETNTVYRNLGDHQFEDISAASGFGQPSFNHLGFGIGLADLDLDGALDAYITNGHIYEQPRRRSVTFKQPDLLLRGDSRGRFQGQLCRWPGEELLAGRGLAVGDYDNDGDPDLAINNNGGPFQLRRNEQAGGRWLGVRLAGDRPNTAGVGARLDLTAADGARQVRWVIAGGSYQSSSDRRPLFGLADGDWTALEITWPTGRRTRILGPPAGRYLIVPEPTD